MNGDMAKRLNYVLAAVAGIALQQRLSLLRMAQQLVMQKLHDSQQEKEKQNAEG